MLQSIVPAPLHPLPPPGSNTPQTQTQTHPHSPLRTLSGNQIHPSTKEPPSPASSPGSPTSGFGLGLGLGLGFGLGLRSRPAPSSWFGTSGGASPTASRAKSPTGTLDDLHDALFHPNASANPNPNPNHHNTGTLMHASPSMAGVANTVDDGDVTIGRWSGRIADAQLETQFLAEMLHPHNEILPGTMRWARPLLRLLSLAAALDLLQILLASPDLPAPTPLALLLLHACVCLAFLGLSCCSPNSPSSSSSSSSAQAAAPLRGDQKTPPFAPASIADPPSVPRIARLAAFYVTLLLVWRVGHVVLLLVSDRRDWDSLPATDGLIDDGADAFKGDSPVAMLLVNLTAILLFLAPSPILGAHVLLCVSALLHALSAVYFAVSLKSASHVPTFLAISLPVSYITYLISRFFHVIPRDLFLDEFSQPMADTESKRRSQVHDIPSNQDALNPRQKSRTTAHYNTVTGWMRKATVRSMPTNSSKSHQFWKIEFSDLQLGSSLCVVPYGEYFRSKFRSADVLARSINLPKTSELMKYYETESCALFGLRHQNIALFLGASMDISQPLYTITEAFPRGNLFDLLHNPTVELDSKKVYKMALSVIQGMFFLHSQTPAIVHLSLNSHNIMVDEEYNLKVSDFGFAKFKLEERATQKISMPNWVAPEILRKSAPSPKSDVYSFGIVYWEMVTRSIPFGNLTPPQVVSGVTFDGIRPEIPASCPLEYSKIFTACWSQEPANRPSFIDLTQTVTIVEETAEVKEMFMKSSILNRPPSAKGDSDAPRKQTVISIIEARNIQLSDASAKLDPMIIIKHGQYEFKTSVSQEYKHPVWNESFECENLDSNERLHLMLVNSSRLSGEEILGECMVPASDLLGIQYLDKWYSFLATNSRSSRDAQVRVAIKINNDDDDEADEHDGELSPSNVVILERLGVGSIGEVWKGKWKGLQVAIKKLYCKRLTSTTQSRFDEELAVYSQLAHPYVNRLYGACTKQGFMFLVSDIAERGTLYSMLRSGKNNSEATNFAFATDICNAMIYLHSQNPPVIHQNLSSQNIVITKSLRAKVTDFGFNSLRGELSSSSLSQLPIWTAPEIFRGVFNSEEKPFSKKSDMYSYAIILSEIFTRKEPFSLELNAAELAFRVVRYGLRPKTTSMSDHFRQFIHDAWDADPNMRPTFEQALNCLNHEAQLCNVDMTGGELESRNEQSFREFTSPVVARASGTDKRLGGSVTAKLTREPIQEQASQEALQVLAKPAEVSTLHPVGNPAPNSHIYTQSHPLHGTHLNPLPPKPMRIAAPANPAVLGSVSPPTPTSPSTPVHTSLGSSSALPRLHTSPNINTKMAGDLPSLSKAGADRIPSPTQSAESESTSSSMGSTKRLMNPTKSAPSIVDDSDDVNGPRSPPQKN